MEKQCKKCLKTRPIDDFYKHSMMADGHLNKCKECTRADVNENRNANAEYYKHYDRKRYDARGRRGDSSSEATRRARAKWAREHKAEIRAHGIVSHAIRSGRLKRPEICSACPTRGKIEAHHEDYSKPLEVTWLCKKCHSKTWTKDRKDFESRKRGGYKGSMLPTRATFT
jgi:hypothetical protein